MKYTRHFRNFTMLLAICLSLNTLFAQDCKEEKVGKSYMTICSDNIVTEKKKLLLTTKAVPKKIENKNTYKVVHYYTSDRTAKSTDETFLEYGKFLRNLELLDFYINGKEFTGVLKIAAPFKNEGVSTKYSGYDILVYEFKEGKFVEKKKLTDVEIEKEKSMIRPT